MRINGPVLENFLTLQLVNVDRFKAETEFLIPVSSTRVSTVAVNISPDKRVFYASLSKPTNLQEQKVIRASINYQLINDLNESTLLHTIIPWFVENLIRPNYKPTNSKLKPIALQIFIQGWIPENKDVLTKSLERLAFNYRRQKLYLLLNILYTEEVLIKEDEFFVCRYLPGFLYKIFQVA